MIDESHLFFPFLVANLKAIMKEMRAFGKANNLKCKFIAQKFRSTQAKLLLSCFLSNDPQRCSVINPRPWPSHP